MRFDPKARLDGSRVRDTRRSGGSGRSRGSGRSGRSGGLPVPGAVAGGGGVVGLIVVVLIIVIGGGDPGSGGLDTGRFDDTDRYASCESGADANDSADCARVAVENSLNDYWSEVLGDRFRPESAIVTFTGSVGTACGAASADVGPFYCPGDQTIYLDSSFFDAVLERRLGGPDGGFVEPYVLAHEYGHHVSDLLGTMRGVDPGTGPQSDGVRLELQADCFAGMWAAHATTTAADGEQPLLAELTSQDVDLALEAAAAVGDDRIQQRTQGQVNAETFTHGSAAQRQAWFRRGFGSDTIDGCDTFSAGRV